MASFHFHPRIMIAGDLFREIEAGPAAADDEDDEGRK